MRKLKKQHLRPEKFVQHSNDGVRTLSLRCERRADLLSPIDGPKLSKSIQVALVDGICETGGEIPDGQFVFQDTHAL